MLPVLWEIIIPLLLAVLLGIAIGWLIWRWRRQVISETEWIVAQERIRTLEGDVGSLQADNERLDAARAAAQMELDDARKAVRGAEADLEGARTEIATLTEAKGAADARIGELDAELSSATSEAADLTTKLAAVSTDLDGARADADAAKADADAAKADADAARAEVDTARSDAEAARTAAAADAEAVKVAAFADLDAAKGDADAAREATAALQAELDLARAEASSAQAAADAARLDAERATADLDAAQAAAATAAGSAAVIAGLEADLAACRSKVEELESADDPETNWQVGVTTLGTPGAAHKDDLKVVNGIGPKMESLLNGFGIQTWEQLAWLDDAQVQTVDDALQEFPGRIERDEWVPQAKDLIVRFPDRADRPTRETFLNRSED